MTSNPNKIIQLTKRKSSNNIKDDINSNKNIILPKNINNNNPNIMSNLLYSNYSTLMNLNKNMSINLAGNQPMNSSRTRKPPIKPKNQKILSISGSNNNNKNGPIIEEVVSDDENKNTLANENNAKNSNIRSNISIGNPEKKIYERAVQKLNASRISHGKNLNNIGNQQIQLKNTHEKNLMNSGNNKNILLNPNKNINNINKTE